jgi:hypothetical protein
MLVDLRLQRIVGVRQCPFAWHVKENGRHAAGAKEPDARECASRREDRGAPADLDASLRRYGRLADAPNGDIAESTPPPVAQPRRSVAQRPDPRPRRTNSMIKLFRGRLPLARAREPGTAPRTAGRRSTESHRRLIKVSSGGLRAGLDLGAGA